MRINFLRPDQKRGGSGSTRDDILNSMTRHAQARDGPTEEGTGHVLEVVDSTGTERQNFPPSDLGGAKTNRHSGKLAFLIFLGGFLGVWGYGFLTRAYDIPFLSLVTQNRAVQDGVQTASAHLLLVGLASGGLLLAILVILAMRRGSS